jgi:hypothetical protein
MEMEEIDIPWEEESTDQNGSVTEHSSLAQCKEQDKPCGNSQDIIEELHTGGSSAGKVISEPCDSLTEGTIVGDRIDPLRQHIAKTHLIELGDDDERFIVIGKRVPQEEPEGEPENYQETVEQLPGRRKVGHESSG